MPATSAAGVDSGKATGTVRAQYGVARKSVLGRKRATFLPLSQFRQSYSHMHPTGLRVALATAAHLPDLTAGDRVLLDELRARGVVAEPAIWNTPLDWTTFDAVIIRSCWDYHLRRDAFVAWLNELTDAGIQLFNPTSLIEWNTDKRYLRELAFRGVPVVPTVWVEPAGSGMPVPELSEVLNAEGWHEAVVKPAVSAGAYETWRTTPLTAVGEQQRFSALMNGASGAVLIQPFLDEVLDEGEWSLIFIAGHFSHAVLKRPAPGDFRVQPNHGGQSELVQASDTLIRDAENVLLGAADATAMRIDEILYARVDGIVQDGRLVLMELECVEPNLFFERAPNAAVRVADVIVERC